jgi:hypothetical protein
VDVVRAACVLSLGLAGACSRESVTTAFVDAGQAAPAPETAPFATAPSASYAATPPTRPPLPQAPPGEAARSTPQRLEGDPLLRPQLARLREHFDGGVHGPFAEQRVELQGGRVAVLLSRPDETEPIVLVLDRDDLVFEKAHPTAGIAAPVAHPTIAPGPEGGVVLFTYVASMRIVAARMWADDSNPYAEIEVFRPDACDALSAAYAPGAGWIVACSSDAGTLAQRLRENLTSAWPHDGLPVGPRSPVVGRPAIAFDGPSTWTLAERAKAVGGDRQITARYGLDGDPR